MSVERTLVRKIAGRLTVHAGSVLPTRRADWGKAMLSELDYMPQGLAALRWSIGCLFTGYLERAKAMEIGTLKSTSLSRVALTLEMLLCFSWPATMLLGLFVTIVFAGYSPFWGVPMSALLLTTSLVGPLGLAIAFKSIVLERPKVSKRITLALCALAGWTFIGNAYFVLTVAAPGYVLRSLALTALLPLAGAAHLVSMAKANRRELASG